MRQHELAVRRPRAGDSAGREVLRPRSEQLSQYRWRVLTLLLLYIYLGSPGGRPYSFRSRRWISRHFEAAEIRLPTYGRPGPDISERTLWANSLRQGGIWTPAIADCNCRSSRLQLLPINANRSATSNCQALTLLSQSSDECDRSKTHDLETVSARRQIRRATFASVPPRCIYIGRLASPQIPSTIALAFAEDGIAAVEAI